MALPKGKPWPTELKYYWTVSIPKAIGGVVPGWSTMLPKILQGWSEGRMITYFDGSQIYYLTAVTSTELRFEGRFAYQYPNTNTATRYIRIIDRSSGAVSNHSARFTISNYT